MKFTHFSIALVLLFMLATPTFAAKKSKVLLEDDFERVESNPEKEEVGNGWGTNSRTRAKGTKQVDLADGAMHITRAAVADHGVSVHHDVAFRDAMISLRFKLGPLDDLGINIADMKEKSVHAGHICMARIRLKKLEIVDLKTGRMNQKSRAARLAKNETPAMKKANKKKSKFFDTNLTPNKWHQLEVKIDGDQMQVSVDGKVVGKFSSPGIGHPTKRRLRLAVNKSAWIDDVKITGW
jgi:hypothetical protein